jgi:hypothetical protein
MPVSMLTEKYKLIVRDVGHRAVCTDDVVRTSRDRRFAIPDLHIALVGLRTVAGFELCTALKAQRRFLRLE